MENNNKEDKENEEIDESKYGKLTFVLIVLLICMLGYLGYSFYNDYQTTIANYEEQIDNLHSTINSKTQSLNNYKDKVDSMNKQIDFMDKYVAICPADGKGLYHKYNCIQYDHSCSFYIYNIGNAEQENFSPCPYCFGETSNTSDAKTEIVYITDTGSKYHMAGCSYLKSKKAITKEQAISQGYSPCSRCNP